MLALNPSEQMLLAAIALAQRKPLAPGDSQRIDDVKAFGPFYFGMYCADWAGALPDLAAQGMVVVQGNCFSLTASGIARAQKLQDGHPRHVYAYNEFYYRARRSAAHTRFCEQVYGRDLCQHGMADMHQLDDLAACLKVDGTQEVLELGCGNGAIAAYTADAANTRVTGVEIAEEGVHWAEEFAARDPDHLTFRAADMTSVDFPANSFDAIVLVDAIYFVPDLPAFLRRMLPWLRPDGKLYIFYSAWVDDGSRRDQLRPDGTPLAQALQALSLAYDIRDYSAGEAAHWRTKRRFAEEMKSEFEAEGNAWLQHRRWIETEGHRPYVENGNVSRYLYQVGRPA